MAEYRISYAQNREDIILSGFFKDYKSGFYVDVGANHPDKLSITKYFYDKGWHGINLEPNRTLFSEIEAQRPRDINLNIGAADKPGELVLREYPEGDGLSTFSKIAQDGYAKKTSEYRAHTKQFVDQRVPVKTLKQVFEGNKVKTINFMNIDVEGFEYEVIQGNDWNKYRPQVICIEVNHIAKDWRPLLEKAKYTLAFFDGLNNYYVADECKNIADGFSYVATMLLDKPVIPWHVDEKLKRMQSQLNQMENKFMRQELVAQDLRDEVNRLNNYIASQKRLRAVVRQLIVSFHTIILLNIEKLNKPKTRSLPPVRIPQNVSEEDRLRELRIYDLQAYFGVKRKPSASYIIVRMVYVATMRLTFRVMKPFLKGAKRAAYRG